MKSDVGTVKPRRLPVWLADRIEDDLIAAGYAVGARLPTEQGLAETYEVSRQVVREAARLLEDRGLVSISAGRGMTVAAPTVEAIVSRYRTLLRRDPASFAALMQLRRIVEVEMTAEAARSRTEADLKGLRAALDAAEAAAGDFRACLDADLAFHIAVARCTQNPFVTAFVEPVNFALREMYTDPAGYLATQERTAREHAAIADAITASDPAAAASAAAAHLARIERDANVLIGADESQYETTATAEMDQ